MAETAVKEHHYQAPQPEVVIYHPDKTGKPIRFDTLNRTALQSYNFSTSINDEKGKFSLTFYPDDENVPFGEETLFDEIQVMDIVEIYETNNHFIQKPHSEMGITTPNILIKEVVPTFTGVIREKKFVSQITGDSARRKFVVTGHSIVGLVHEFFINLDIQASVITKQLANNRELEKQFTIQFIQNDNAPLKVSDVIKKIWKSFIDLSSRYDKLSTPKIAEYIKTWIGDEDVLFCVDDTVFHYPIASIFKGETTQTFYNIIAGIIPKPVYEVYPYMDRSIGKMRLMIREVPFDEAAWKKLDAKVINPGTVKAFELSQNDKEVYTVFFSYLAGYPVQEDKAVILAAQGVTEDPKLTEDKKKYGVYGYRPLFVTFNGYGRADGTEDTETGDRLQKLNERLKNWYANKEKMFSGSITMETDLNADMPQAGEKISFLGGEFYVIDTEHNWNFGGSPETRITVDRGGDYDTNGAWHEMKSVTGRFRNRPGEAGEITQWR